MNQLMGSKHSFAKWLQSNIAKLLDTQAEKIELKAPFMSLGLSSLDLIEMCAQFKTDFKEELDPILLFEHPDIESLVDHFFLTERKSNRTKVKKQKSKDDIAIIGMSCRFPGAKNEQEFWDLLTRKESAITKIPDDRFSKKLKFDAYAGLIDEIDRFDAEHFLMNSNEAKSTDPQHRLLLETSWKAIENAGINPHDLRKSNTGVFVGISSNDYFLTKFTQEIEGSIYDGPGSAHSIAANRMSFFYDFKGPSFAVDTACSSSLVAIHQAYHSLLEGECDMALAGGVNLILSPFLMESFHKANMLSSDGQCRSFSENANGYVRSEGVGVILLKRLSDAIENNDNILGVIKGSAINQDGKTSTITAPNGTSQVDVLLDALDSAELVAEDISYIETHGTGTPLGDPIEYKSIAEVYHQADLMIGSVKSNIGHLEAAAGMAGIIKSVLCLNHDLIPGNFNFQNVNPKIRVRSNIKILSEHTKWDEESIKRIGVSSFGFGGTNAHIILEEAPRQLRHANFKQVESNEYNLFQLCASSKDSLEKNINSYINYLKDSNNEFTDICSNLLNNKARLKKKVVLVSKSKDELIGQLKKIINNDLRDPSVGLEEINQIKKTVYSFTGQGSQYPYMGKDIYFENELFRSSFNKCLDLFQKKVDVHLYKLWASDSDEIHSTFYSQIYLFSFSYSLFQLVYSLGIKPDLLVGHSLGELVALSCAEAIDLNDAIDLVFSRAEAMESSEEGAMLAVLTNSTSVEDLVGSYNLDIAVINGKDNFVLSGKKEDLLSIQKDFKEKNIKSTFLKVERAFHSRLMDSVLDKFFKSIQKIEFRELQLPVYSSFLNKYLSNTDINSQFFVNQLRGCTNFYQTICELKNQGFTHHLEIGPKPVLSNLVRSEMRSIENINFSRQGKNSFESFLTGVGKLILKGFDLKFNEVYSKEKRNFVKLPDFIFDAKSYWHDGINKSNLSLDRIEPVKKKKVIIDESKLIQELKELLSDELGLPIEEFSIDQNLMDYGTDSLAMLHCLESINEKYDVSIHVNDIFQDLNTISAIASFIATELSERSIDVESNVQFTGFELDQSENMNLEALIKTQIHIMNKQLEILTGHPMKSNFRVDTSSRSKQVINDDQKSLKGVLGNFSTNYSSAKTSSNTKFLNEFIKKYIKKTSLSKEYASKHRDHLADNRVSAGFRPNLKEIVYPIVFEKAHGAHFIDLNGNDYVDFTMGFGVNLFGHSPEFINTQLLKQVKSGIAVGPQSAMAGKVAQLFCEITGNQRVTFVNSGTEALMTAIRLARAKTGREKIVLFEGSYHGHFDGVLGRKTKSGETVPVARGIPRSLTDGVIVLDYDSEEALEILSNQADEIAAVIVEPVQSRFPEIQPKKFLKRLREITKKSKSALIFDEVITGFRVAKNGAQEYFEIEADLACYGKVLGGGLPIGAVAGDKKFLDFIDGGDWRFGDSSMPLNEMTFFAGTFCKHPLAMIASYETLNKIKNEGNQIFKSINELTDYLAKSLNDFFEEAKIPLTIVHFGSLFRFKFTGNFDLLFYFLNYKGFYIWEGRNMFISTAHTKDDVDSFIKAVKESINELNTLGLISQGKLSPSIETKTKNLPFYHSHRRFNHKSEQSDIFHKLSGQIHLNLKLRGNLDILALKESFSDLFLRYKESLNINFNLENEQLIFGGSKEFKVDLIDFSNSSGARGQIDKYLQTATSKVLDPNQEPINIEILKVSDDEHILFCKIHHLVMDGLSIAFMTDDLAKIYSAKKLGRRAKLKPIYSFSEFLEDQDRNQNKKTYKEELEFWNEESKKWVLPFESKQDFKGERLKVVIPEENYKSIRMFGYKNKSSLFLTTLSVFYRQLAKYIGKEQFTIGAPYMGHESIDKVMIGNCVNTIPYTFSIEEGELLTETVARLKKYQLDLNRYCEIPFEKMIHNKEDPIEVMYNVEPLSKLPKFKGVEADLELCPVHASEYPLMFNLMKLNNEIIIEMDYQFSLFSKEEAQKFIEEFRNNLLDIKA